VKDKMNDLFVPDQANAQNALLRTTHLGIGAHQDDLEFMAMHGILKCYQKRDSWFGGVVCTDGTGSSRMGDYREYTDDEMKNVRLREQNKAAVVGEYSFMSQLGHPSSVARKRGERAPLVEDLIYILKMSRPNIVYTHNPFDKHATHVGVFQATVEAILSLEPEERPQYLWGCEVWRGLDWLPDSRKLILDVSERSHLSAALNRIFDSQIAGGKRYDLAVEGRRRANATFLDSHQTDDMTSVIYALDCSHCMKMNLEAFYQGAWLDEEINYLREAVQTTWKSSRM